MWKEDERIEEGEGRWEIILYHLHTSDVQYPPFLKIVLRLQRLPPSSGFKSTSAFKIQVVMFFQNLGTHLLDYQSITMIRKTTR
jgi:hypothetical protein